jgi:hypothetical protein
MTKAIVLGFALLLCGRSAFSQHLGELSADYSYLHYVPANNFSAVNLNGGGGAAVLYFAGVVGIKGEFEAYAGKDVPFNFKKGNIRCPSDCSGTAHANLFTVNVGPTIKIRVKGLQPFVEGTKTIFGTKRDWCSSSRVSSSILSVLPVGNKRVKVHTPKVDWSSTG